MDKLSREIAMTDDQNHLKDTKNLPVLHKWFASLQGRMLFVLLGLTIGYGVGLWTIRNWQSQQVDTALRKEVIQKQEFFDKLLELRGRQLYSYAYDYTFWDEMVHFVEEPDSTWGAENLVESMSTYDARAVWVYDPDFRLVYHVCEQPESLLCDLPVLREAYRPLFAKSPLAHFFAYSPVGLLEIRGATIHPTNDNERRTPARGYFFAMSPWDEAFLDELGQLANGQVSVQPCDRPPVEEGGEYDRKGHVSWRRALHGWDKRPVAVLEVETISAEVQQQLRVANLVSVLSALLTMALLGFTAYIMARWIVLPLRRITGSLNSEEIGPIRKLLSQHTELGHIARLIEQFFQQKSELVQEIEDRRRAEREKEKLESQLRRVQRLETIGTLAGGVAHDFNNLLTPILGFSDLALRQLELNHPVCANIEEVIKAAHRAKDLVRQILIFSREAEPEHCSTQLHLVFKEALKLIRASLPATIEIRENLDGHCGTVSCDPSQMHQVLMNLCTNAFDAMRESGGVLEVSLDSLEVDHTLSCLHVNLNEGHYARLSVSDTGCGMDRTTMERIFEPFFSTKKVGEGTGLGLSVVHGIVRAHGGGITVYSEPGIGTTFRIYLPMQPQGGEEIALRNQPIMTGSERVLFVDDEHAIVNMGKMMLERLGYHVTATTSSEEAFWLFHSAPDSFDLLITDQTMPYMTGDRLAKEALNIRPDLPIVLITGFSERVTELNYRALGIREFAMKPLLMRDLAEAVRRALEPQSAPQN